MFNSEAEILNFGPRASRRWSAHRYLLWPALAYRVTAPRIRSHTLNPLQKAVALLVRTGLLKANEIGPKLDIHDDLAHHILVELWQLGYLTQTGVSENGLKALRDDSVLSYDWVSGFIFQDPWSGKLWPRFVSDLNFCDYSYKDHLHLHLGTEGKPRNVRPTLVDFPVKDSSIPFPRAEEVIRAIRRGDRQANSTRSARYADEDVDAVEFPESQSAGINQITEVDATRRSVFLTTFLYVPEPEQADDRRPTSPPAWAVCDPFGFSEIPELYNQIHEVARGDNNLQWMIARLLEDSGYQPGYAGMRDWEDRAVEDAQGRITQIFSNSIQGYEGVFSELVAFESKYRIARDVPERTAGLPRELLKVLESVFIWCIKTYPPGAIWQRVFYEDRNRKTGRMDWFPIRHRSDYQEAYRYAARELGLEPAERFLRTHPNHIRAVVEYNHNSKFTASVCAQVMYAAEVDDHPLRRVAREIPNLLEMLETIASDGGKAGHADGGERTFEHCQALRRDCFRIVASILNLNLKESDLDR